MADLNVTRFIIDGKAYAIPSASSDKKGLMSAADFTKLQGIAANAEANKIEGVKVNGVALAIAAKIVDILIKTGTANGTVSVNDVDVPVKGLAALAYKAKVSKADFDTALDAAFSAKAEQSSVTALSGKIDVLNGAGAGSVKKAIDDAFNDFATKVSDDKVINTYKELIDWAASHGGDVAKITGQISKIEAMLVGIGSSNQPATVMAAIQKAITELNIGNYYNKSQVDEKLAAKVDKVPGMNLSHNDFTNELKSKLEGIDAKATANTVSYDSVTETLTLTGFTTAGV